MNENIDLTKILQDCPKGWKFFTPICGEVKFCNTSEFLPIAVTDERGLILNFSKEGFYNDHGSYLSVECLLFPPKDQRDWSKFTAPWYKKEKFDPKTLKAFDKVLVRDECYQTWKFGFFFHINDDNSFFPYITANSSYAHCIPYNDDTKHLVGTTDEAPEYYRHLEDL